MSARFRCWKHWVLAAVAGVPLTFIATSVALAQSASAPEAKLERVEVTGSSIKRIEGETALPVQVLTRDDIQRLGVTTTEQLLKQVTATATLGGTSVANTGAGGGQGGTGSVSLISLRGLGSTRTLVLINGRRSAPAAGANAVDIATIPIAMIDRVEVLKDGASAVYGSDAVAGVVNFILRRDVTGTEIASTVGSPTRHGGGLDTKVSAISGFGNVEQDRYNVTIAAAYERTKSILGSDRSFATNLDVQHQLDKTSTTSFPANIVTNSGAIRSPTYPNCAPSEVSPLSPGLCRFDNAPTISLQPETKLENVAANGRFKITSSMEAYVESSYTRNETRTIEQPVLINGAVQPAGQPYIADLNNLLNTRYPTFTALRTLVSGKAYALLPPSSPYYPTAFAAANGLAGQPLVLLFRSYPTGLRKTQDISQNSRFVTGLRGNTLGWDYDAAFLYSKDKITQNLTGGWALTDQYLNLVNTGVINPFGPTASQAALDQAQATNYNGLLTASTTSITGVNGKASRDLFELPAGTMSLAVGAEFRREMLDLAPSDANKQFLIAGFGAPGVPVSAARNVESAYAEINIPIAKGLEGDVAGRFDNYERVGKTFNPKGSIRWQPVEQLLFRASYGKGFRAPTLVDLYQPPARGITTNGSRDLVRCPIGFSGIIDCSTQFVTIGGGNPALKPEKSKSESIGVVWEPTKDYSIGTDIFYVQVKDTIRTGLSVATILADPVRYANLITRGAPDGNASGVGPILGISQALTNLGKTNVSGVDVNLLGRVYNTPGDKVTLRLDGTYFTRYDTQNLDGSYSNAINNPAASGLGIGVVLRWRHVASATYEHGPFALTFQHNYQNGYGDLNTSLQPASTPVRQVGSYTTLDTQLAYTGIKNAKLSIGVKNLADRDPPYTNYGAGFVGGYDLSYADVRGRFVYGSASYKFF